MGINTDTIYPGMDDYSSDGMSDLLAPPSDAITPLSPGNNSASIPDFSGQPIPPPEPINLPPLDTPTDAEANPPSANLPHPSNDELPSSTLTHLAELYLTEPADRLALDDRDAYTDDDIRSIPNRQLVPILMDLDPGATAEMHPIYRDEFTQLAFGRVMSDTELHQTVLDMREFLTMRLTSLNDLTEGTPQRNGAAHFQDLLAGYQGATNTLFEAGRLAPSDHPEQKSDSPEDLSGIEASGPFFGMGTELDTTGARRLAYAQRSKQLSLSILPKEALEAERDAFKAESRATQTSLGKAVTTKVLKERAESKFTSSRSNPFETNKKLNHDARIMRVSGRLLQVVAVGAEVVNVVNAPPQKRAEVAAQGAGRLAGGYYGATIGAEAGIEGGILGVVAGAIIGGAVGSIGGEQLVNKLNPFKSGTHSPSDQPHHAPSGFISPAD